GVFGFELVHLEINNNEAPKSEVIKEEIDKEILAFNFEWVLTSDKGEADSKLQKKLLEMLDQAPFKVAFLGLLTEAQKIEVVRIFDNLLSEFGLWRRKSSVEIRNGLPLPVEEIAFNLVNENVPAPSVLDSLLRVPNPLRQSLHLVQNRAVMEPWQLCSNLLHKVVIRPSFGESPHIFEISWGKA